MKVHFVANDGSGFNDFIEIPSGTTVKDLFTQRIGSKNINQYRIRVNSEKDQQCDRVLVEGDRVVVTPTNFQGA